MQHDPRGQIREEPHGIRDPMMFDSNVRTNLAELVQSLLASGNLDKLHGLLKEHQTFITDIMEMIEKEKNKRSK